MTREQAIELLRAKAIASTEAHGYLSDAANPNWMPHEWSIEAVIEAARDGAAAQATDAQIERVISELVGDKSFPDTTPCVPSYWLNSDDIRAVVAALKETP